MSAGAAAKADDAPPPCRVLGGGSGVRFSPSCPPPDATVNRCRCRGPTAGLSSGREVTWRSGDGGGDRRIGCKGHCPPPPSGGKQKMRSPVGGDDNDDANVHDDNGDDDAGGGDRASRFDGVRRSRIHGLVAGRRQLHSEMDDGDVPAGLHRGDDDNAVPPPPRDRGSRRRSIVVVVILVALGIPSRWLPDGRINEDDGNDGNNTGAVAGQSRS